MAIAHRASATANNASTTSFSISKPAGVVAGDVLVAFIGSTATGPGTPAGWTLQADSFAGQFVYSKIAGASEPASYTWTAGSAQRWDGGISAFTGVSNGTPWDVVPVFSTFTATAASVTTATPGAMLVGGAENAAVGNITPPAGFTEWWESAGTTHAEMAGAIQAAAGASGSKTWTVGTPNAAWLGALQDATQGPQSIVFGTGVASAESVGMPVVAASGAAPPIVFGAGVPSAEVVGQPTLTQVSAGTQTIVFATGIPSAEHVGQPSLTMGSTILEVKVRHRGATDVRVRDYPIGS